MTIKFSREEIRFISILLIQISRAPNGSMSERQIIELSEKSGWLTQKECSSVPSRTDSRFANKVHNTVSHRDSKCNPLRLGFIRWDSYSSEFAITGKGLTFLQKVTSMIENPQAGGFSSVENWLAHEATIKKGAANAAPFLKFNLYQSVVLLELITASKPTPALP